MASYLETIHSAIGDYTDDSSWIEEAAVELAMRLDWYHNGQTYRDAAQKQLKVLSKIPGTDDIRASIVNKIMAKRPYDINAIQQIIDGSNS